MDFKELLDNDDVVVAPGVWDGLSAILAARADFEAVTISGFAVSASMGLPDLGLYSSEELLGRVREVANAVPLPVMSDIDTGYGGPANVQRTVRRFEAAGASAFFLEDQQSPKVCPLYSDGTPPLVDLATAEGRIRAAAEAKQERSLLVARTDATGDEAVARLTRFRDAGADLLMIMSKTFASISELTSASELLDASLVVTVSPGSWIETTASVAALAGVGTRIVVPSTVGIEVSAAAVGGAFASMRSASAFAEVSVSAMNHLELADLVGLERAAATNAKYSHP